MCIKGHMNFDFRGKRALVTGAGKGLLILVYFLNDIVYACR